ncbi:MAG: mechanosensitive ion channel family protein, partial [Leptospiraceae bacterium]|nr:mechanosensitive ion channel family protein [Leptospiraceae bacterium]
GPNAGEPALDSPTPAEPTLPDNTKPDSGNLPAEGAEDEQPSDANQPVQDTSPSHPQEAPAADNGTDEEARPVQIPRALEGPATFFQYLQGKEFRDLMEAVGWSTLLIVTLAFSIWLITYIFQTIYSKLEGLASRLATGIRFRGAEIMQAETMQAVLRAFLRLLHLVLNILLILLVADWIISLFPGAEESPSAKVVRSVVRALVATMVFLTLFRGLRRGFALLNRSIPILQSRFIPDLEFQNTVLLSRDRLLGALQALTNGLKIACLLLISYFYMAGIFGLFEATENWASVLLGYVQKPLHGAAVAFVAYLPNLFFILVVIVATRYLVKFAGFLFREIEKGTIEINGFYPDWARPTHKILAVVLIAFASIIAFPYLPGANSDAFKGISIFLGFMVSLGSSAIIANIMAGVVITYMRPFRVGDRVKIGDTEGDIIEKSLLVTRIRTVKNVEITIPNGTVLASHIVNYSTAIDRKETDGLILHSTVTIGYDVPYKQVQELLIQAASELDFIKKTPAPFVLQTSLDDYYISYQINCYTDHPDRMARIYSALHQNILDRFNEAGVEIMSPHYYALRDGNQITLPEKNLPANYRTPGFRLSQEENQKEDS